jgi:hypothetical protein
MEMIMSNIQPPDENLSPWQKYKKNLGDTRPWDYLSQTTEYATEEKSSSRYSICLSCPELINLTKTCKKCGCFMAAKTKLEKAHCPINKW